MLVKVKWLTEMAGHGKKDEIEAVDDQYAADCEAAGYCEIVGGNPRTTVTGAVKKSKGNAALGT